MTGYSWGRLRAEAPLASKFASYFNKIMGRRKVDETKAAEIVKRYLECRSITTVAREVGLSEATVSGHLVQRGVHRRKSRVQAPEGMKYCGRCGSVRPLTGFFARGKGLSSWCKQCDLDRNKHHSLVHTLRALDVSEEEYKAAYALQNGRCTICGVGEGHKSKHGNPARLSVDHDHITGRLRGLLCNRCNRGLGYFGDSPDLIRRALSYLVEVGRER